MFNCDKRSTMLHYSEEIFTVHYSVTAEDIENGLKSSFLLARESGLSQQKIKKAMQSGAVWLQRKQLKRLRRASKELFEGDELQLYYNASILQQSVNEPQLISDEGQYSIWFKPYGLYCQGSKWGDFCAINRWVEMHFQPQRPTFLVHRLDRATSGILLLAHTKKAAQLFSDLFAQRKIVKSYQAVVEGDARLWDQFIELHQSVGGKKASTLVRCNHISGPYSLLDIRLNTGRKHQIRQHLSIAGFPIVGDRLYGTYDQDSDIEQANLQLQAVSLAFNCPFSGMPKSYEAPHQQHLDMKALYRHCDKS